ncbi:MAG: hypothetical protein CBB97_21465 [Candidatus Endolissoclinum sp. TMED37]|nr:MAG: hypothetical protein CBB97_21465 [Candidatus Endolissoclinum sp. TMED37]
MRTLTKVEQSKAIADIENEGFTIVEAFLNDAEVEKSRELVNSAPKYEAPNKTSSTVYGLATLDKWFLDMADEISLSNILSYFLNDQYFGKISQDFPNYIIAYSNARTSSAALPTHIDSYVPNTGRYPLLMQSMFALENQNKSNGNTYIVPKSHLFGEFPDQQTDHPDTIDVYSKAGDLVIWDSRIWHGARENVSKQTRWAIINTYSRWWIKPRQDSTKNITNEFYQTISDRQKALLGFCSIPPSDPSERVVTRIGFEDLPEQI